MPIFSIPLTKNLLRSQQTSAPVKPADTAKPIPEEKFVIARQATESKELDKQARKYYYDDNHQQRDVIVKNRLFWNKVGNEDKLIYNHQIRIAGQGKEPTKIDNYFIVQDNGTLDDIKPKKLIEKLLGKENDPTPVSNEDMQKLDILPGREMVSIVYRHKK